MSGSTLLRMTGRRRRSVAADGWLMDLLRWVQSPLELFTPARRRPGAPQRRVHLDADGDPVEPPDVGSR